MDTSTKVKLLQIEMSDDQFARLDKLLADCGLLARKDLFDCAMNLLEAAVQAALKGRSIGFIDQEKREITILRIGVLDTLLSQASGTS